MRAGRLQTRILAQLQPWPCPWPAPDPKGPSIRPQFGTPGLDFAEGHQASNKGCERNQDGQAELPRYTPFLLPSPLLPCY